MSQNPGCDPTFLEVINKIMSVPERLSVGLPGQQWQEDVTEDTKTRQEKPPPAYTMMVPERLTYTEAPDMSPRPLFKPTIYHPLGLEPCWESPSGEMLFREAQQSPIRRSYSDQSFGRTPPSTPTRLKQELTVPRHPSSFRGPDHPYHLRSNASHPEQMKDSSAQPLPSNLSPSLLSVRSAVQTAMHLGLQASQCLMQMVNQKYRLGEHMDLSSARVTTEVPATAYVEDRQKRAAETWSPEEEGGAAVELIILRRQVMKMSRRLAALERHNFERRSTEVVLFSLLLSACLLNMWLWIRR